MEAEKLWSLLTSPQRLQRDQGVARLEDVLQQASGPDCLKELLTKLSVLAGRVGVNDTWETKFGMLTGARSIVAMGKAQMDFCHRILPQCSQFVHDPQIRVRYAAGELLGEMCHHFGIEVYLECRASIISLIRHGLEQSAEVLPAAHLPLPPDAVAEDDDWQLLESSIRCLRNVIRGCGRDFVSLVDEDLLQLLIRCITHPNRFVRESGFRAFASLAEVVAVDQGRTGCPISDELARSLSKCLADGLTDRWSQVRLAATVATSHFLRPQRLLADDEVMRVLIPRLCLNRYWLAEGVRFMSQTTWWQVVGTNGKALVEKYLQETVNFYISCVNQPHNPGAREPTCHCIAELACKIDRGRLRPFVPQLMASLLTCFKDEQWPVRDMACVASGMFVKNLPDALPSELQADLVQLFFANLGDPITCVRQGAAQSLANVVLSYSAQSPLLLRQIMDQARAGLRGVARQQDVLQPENEPHLHPDALDDESSKPGVCGGCCTNARFRKASEPWELADGCVYLMLELSRISEQPQVITEVVGLLPCLIEACRFKHYAFHYVFFETVTKTLPFVAKSVGKKHFKPLLEDFFEIIFYACEHENALAVSAALFCLKELSIWLGPNILRGRVENYGARYLVFLDEAVDLASHSREPVPVPSPTQPAAVPIHMDRSYRPPLGGTPTGSPP